MGSANLDQGHAIDKEILLKHDFKTNAYLSETKGDFQNKA